MNNTIIDIETVLGGVKGVDFEDGQQIYNLILKAFFDNKKVILSFDSMEVLSDEFLQSAVGQLYKDYSHAEIKENMLIENISLSGKIALKRIVDKAKMIY